MGNYTIRPAKAGDIDILIDIASRAWKPIYDGFAEQLGEEVFGIFYPDPLGGKADQIRRDVESGNCFISEIDGKIAGFIRYDFDSERKLGTICNNAVNSDFRGMGIGGRQYDFIFELLRDKGAVGVRVTTGLDEAHAPARRAYEKAGFTKYTEAVTYMKKL